MNRRHYLAAGAMGIALILVAASVSFTPRLVWNASASTPIGLYRIDPEPSLMLNELVAIMPPEPLAGFLDDGGYLPRGLPLLKHIAAIGGQRVCRHRLVITVDGREIGRALDADRRGRPLPIWEGCRMITEGELFFMNTRVKASLDGRYFGPIERSAVIGRAVPLYTDEAGNGHFVWRAPAR
jgi:conjugative transfer signal peptidase TraF